MVPLALAFQQRGHGVAWATSPDALLELAQTGFKLFPAGLAMDDARRIYHQRWPEAASLRGEEHAGHTFPRLFGGVVAPAMIADLEAALDLYAPDLVVLEPAALAMPLACQRQDVKYVTHGYGLKLPQSHLNEAMREFAPHWQMTGIEPPQDAGLYRDLYIDIAPPSLQTVQEFKPDSSQLLSPSASQSMCEPDLPSRLLHAMICSRQPKIYLTFGTVFNQLEALRTAAIGLARLDAVVVATVGGSGNMDDFSSLPENVHVERYLNQAALLKHCSAVVSHGGAGTVLGAAAYGVPQLILPQAADHFRNARALANVGAGLVIGNDRCTPDAIESSALCLLTTPAFATAAQCLADEIRLMPSVDDVVTRLEKSQSVH